MDELGFLNYTRTFEVIFEDRTTANPNDALLALPITKYDAYSYAGYTDTYSRATSVTATPENDSVTYTVVVQYTPQPIETLQMQKTWSFNAYTEVLISDLDFNVIANSAGDRFPEGIETQRFLPVLTITRPQATFDPLNAFSFMGTINSGSFYGAPQKTARCVDYSGTMAYLQNGSTYWNVTYSFEFGFFPHGQGWDAVLLDEGYNEINTVVERTGSENKKRRITIAGNPVNEPQKLDGTGKIETRQGYGWFKYFRVYPLSNFGFLDLE